MAGSSLLALLDDIATTLDDVAVLTKVAAKKTTGVLGDDLALNAQQVAGVAADRELPVVWAVAKGSFVNKIILVPSALLISQLLPQLIVPLLMLGGAFLCFEGFEKVFEKLVSPKGAKHQPTNEIIPENISPAELEKQKIKGAIRTDFILSAEIVVITLGTVAQEVLLKQATVLTGISLLMTVGVYGFVALIVKLDDIGYYLNKDGNQNWKRKFGKGLLAFAPKLMHLLGIAGTGAMFLVGGGIFSHNIPALHHLEESAGTLGMLAIDLLLGAIIGGVCMLLIVFFKQVSSKQKA